MNAITNIFLNKIRLSYYFIILFVLFAVIEIFIPHLKFDGGALTLFSVNSFLYGFLYFTNTDSSKDENRRFA